jgi:glycosyltransferase involved in cell wall biosynthesis
MGDAVTVVMTAYNAERFIAEALRSAIDQTAPPAAIVVVDDGSTDGTAEIAASIDPGIAVHRQPHQGIGAGRNAGLAAVETDLVALLDADDVWLPQKLERQLAALAEQPAREAIFCLVDEFADPDDPPPPRGRAPRTAQAAALSSNALLRRDVSQRIGAFGLAPIGDWIDWWARARVLGIEEHIVPEVLLRRRIHGGNNSLQSDDQRTVLEIAHRHLRAMRARRAADAEDGG